MIRRIKTASILLVLCGVLPLSGCSIIGAFMIMKNATCEVKINDKCVKGSCELINGVFFERLTVLNADANGMPSEFIVTERFTCYNAGSDGVQEYWPSEIYFHKPNGHYKWRADTVDIHFKMNGRSREIVSFNKKPEDYNERFISGSKNFDTCPIAFQNSTWYNVRISDQRLSKVLMYVDEKMKIRVYKYDSGISPI